LKDFFLKLPIFLSTLANPWAGWILALVALGDSSFLSLLEVNDALIIMLTLEKPRWMAYYCAMTTLGSVSGCFILYGLGRRGRNNFLLRRIPQQRLARVMHWEKKYGGWALLISSVLPPPTPFKVFVLTAGMLRTSTETFLVSVSIGRTIRYFSVGVLALLFGRQALFFLNQNSVLVGWSVFAVLMTGLLVWGVYHFRWTRLRDHHGSSSDIK
jgi:membrane protein YqaA with SNARE-associated domain